MSDDEKDYEEPQVKLQTSGNLETCKKAFVNNELETFKQEVLSKKFKVYESTYKYSSDYDGSNEIVVRNRVSGFCQSIGAHRKYCFVAVKCFKQEDSQYFFKLYWIVNTDLKSFLKDDYDDYDWCEVDLSDYSPFEYKFKEEPFAFGYVH